MLLRGCGGTGAAGLWVRQELGRALCSSQYVGLRAGAELGPMGRWPQHLDRWCLAAAQLVHGWKHWAQLWGTFHHLYV